MSWDEWMAEGPIDRPSTRGAAPCRQCIRWRGIRCHLPETHSPLYHGLYIFHTSRSFHIQCEPPNAHLYVYDGTVVSAADTSQREPLTTDNLLLRGCTLRKTDWAVSGGGGEG